MYTYFIWYVHILYQPSTHIKSGMYTYYTCKDASLTLRCLCRRMYLGHFTNRDTSTLGCNSTVITRPELGKQAGIRENVRNDLVDERSSSVGQWHGQRLRHEIPRATNETKQRESSTPHAVPSLSGCTLRQSQTTSPSCCTRGKRGAWHLFSEKTAWPSPRRASTYCNRA